MGSRQSRRSTQRRRSEPEPKTAAESSKSLPGGVKREMAERTPTRIATLKKRQTKVRHTAWVRPRLSRRPHRFR